MKGDRELRQIVAEVDTSDPRTALLGPCPWCDNRPPVCYGAAMFVNCTGPRAKHATQETDNG